MTEETSGASAPSSLQPSPSQPASTDSSLESEVRKDILAIYQRLQNIEAHLCDQVKPRLLALEEAMESLAISPASGSESLLNTLRSDVSELRRVVASLGGAVVGVPGHDAGRFFFSWWDKIIGKVDPAGSARSPQIETSQSASGASVTNSGPLSSDNK